MSLVGRKLGPYKVVAELGSGGMALVYQAEQPSLGRMVAIKELRKELARDDSLVTRFEREARSVAALAHQNIVHVYDYLERSSSMFIVMEYVEGLDLAQLLQKVERLPHDIAAIIGLQAIRALEYAHFRGVVHRDFKPANLMLTKQGEAKLMDFGIARDEAEEDLTLPGTALGTPAYMSPEQVMGERVTPSSDVFSFGIVLYQMLTGKRPFVDDENVGVMQKIVAGPYVRPRAIYPDIPLALQRIIKRCLRKEPSRRYDSTEDLRLDLEKYVSKHVRINYNGRLVIFMRHRGLISTDEATTYVRPEQLESHAQHEDLGEVSAWRVAVRPTLVFNMLAFLSFIAWIVLADWLSLGVLPKNVGAVLAEHPWAVSSEATEPSPKAPPPKQSKNSKKKP